VSTAAEPSELSREDKDEVRGRIFRHDDGIGVGPPLWALHARGAIPALLARRRMSMKQIVALVGGHRGYLHVAMRLLASQGWVELKGTPATDELAWLPTARGDAAMALAPHYLDAVAFLPAATRMPALLFGGAARATPVPYPELVARALRGWELPSTDDINDPVNQVRHHLDGLLAGPTVIALKNAGVLDRFSEANPALDLGSISGDRAALDAAFELLQSFGWVQKRGPHLEATPRGLFAFASSRAWAYGVPVSYLPLLSRLDELIFGEDPGALFARDAKGNETHVQRALNVKASGAAHTPYFRKIDEIVVEIFSRPIEQQPKFICDMGSGDGTFLKHLWEVIWDRTPRGAAIQRGTAPLLMIGADYNPDARHATASTLQAAGIAHRVVFGDINDPDALAIALKEHGVTMSEGMHVRSFLDHNRPYTGVQDAAAAAKRVAKTTGAFAWRGRAIPNGELEQNLVEHFRRWAPYVARFGLLVLELHTLPTPLAAANIGRTLATGYDATHGFSDQLTVEADVFEACAREAGLTPDPRHAARFPPGPLSTVTINRFSAG